MKHVFSSGISDGADATLVRPSNWNDTHVLGVTATIINLTLNTTNDYVGATGGVAGITITLPAASARSGAPYTIKKVDAGIGAVTVTAVGGDTIDGFSTYELGSQFQYVVIVSDGSSAWNIIGNN